jgi:alcohol dehydrogenase YqhD (iron-dependent ADH family)
MQDGLPKFRRFAENVWGVNPTGKSAEQIASEGLSAMEAWMNELGLVMNIRDLGVTEDMLDGIAEGSFIMPGGYKVLTKADIIEILKASM